MSPITPNTKFSIGIGVALAACVTMIGFGWQAQRTLGAIEERLRVTEKRADDSLSIERASEIALRTAIKNPGFRVIDPRDPSQIIVVEVGGVKPLAGEAER